MGSLRRTDLPLFFNQCVWRNDLGGGGATDVHTHTHMHTNTFTISICPNDEHFFIVYYDSLMLTKINSMLALLDACFFLLVNNGTMRRLALSFVDDIAGGLGLVFWAVVNGMNDCRDMIRRLVFERNYFTWKLWYIYIHIFLTSAFEMPIYVSWVCTGQLLVSVNAPTKPNDFLLFCDLLYKSELFFFFFFIPNAHFYLRIHFTKYFYDKNIAKILQKYCRNIAKILQTHCKHIAKILPKYC